MFKRMLAILFMMVFVFSVSAQISDNPPRFDEGVLSLNGSHWMATPASNKKSFILGIFFGLDTMRQFVYQMKESENFKAWLEEEYGSVVTLDDGIGNSKSQVDGVYDFMDMLIKWALFEEGADVVVAELDKIYKDPENRKYLIFEVLLVTYDKQWWSLE